MSEEADLARVVELELRLLAPAVRADRIEVERLVHPDFREVGASGRLWDRDSIVAELAADPGEERHVTDVEARFVGSGGDAVLVTYAASTGVSASLRSSVWVRAGDGWQVLWHQGTPAAV